MNQTQRTKKVLCSKHALGEFYPPGRKRGKQYYYRGLYWPNGYGGSW
jgi:hypothetical protein